MAGARLVIRNNTLDLIRKDSPVFKKYLAYMNEFDVRDEIVVVLKSDDLKASRAAANALANRTTAHCAAGRREPNVCRHTLATEYNPGG